MGDLVYEASDYNAGLPVAVAEVEALLARGGRPISKDERKTVHFLQRVKETIDSLNVDLAHLRRRVDELSVQSSRRGVATTLNPVDALKYASPEEIEQVVGRLNRQRLSTLRHQVSQSLAELEEVRGLSEKAASVVREAVESGEVPEEVAERVLAALEVPEISSKHVLDESFYNEDDLAWERENMPEVTEAIARVAPTFPKSEKPGEVAGPEVREVDTGEHNSPEQVVNQEVPEDSAQDEGTSLGESVSEDAEVKLEGAPPPVFGSNAPPKTEENPFAGGWAQDLIREQTQNATAEPVRGGEETPDEEADLDSLFGEEK